MYLGGTESINLCSLSQKSTVTQKILITLSIKIFYYIIRIKRTELLLFKNRDCLNNQHRYRPISYKQQ